MESLLVSIFESFLGESRKHNEDTGQIAFDCPVCSAESNSNDGDGKGNLEINYHRGLYKCWACPDTNHMYGRVTNLVKRHGSPKNLRDYLLIKPDADDIVVREHKEILVTLPEDYKKLSECNFSDFKYNLAMDYLRARGITDEIIKEYEIGYAYKGKSYHRIIIPSYDAEGELNYYIARWFHSDYNKLKYINPTVEKQEIIFNEYKINWYSTIYLVEGVFDHIVTPNSIPLLGKVISDKLLDTLHDKAKAFIVIVLDDDAYDDAVSLYRRLNFGDLRGKIKIVKPPKGYDPSKIYEVAGPKGVISVLMNSYKLPDR
jgi:hypothetical protein